MILLLRGGDELAVRRRLADLKAEADGGTGLLTTNLTQIEGKDAKAEEIIAAAMTPPFLAPRRLVIVDRFLDRWESTRAERETGDELPPEPKTFTQYDKLFAAIESGIPPSTSLVITGGVVGRSNPMARRLKGIKGVAEEVYSEPKRRDEIARFIREEGAARGIRFRSSRPTGEHWDSDEWVVGRNADPVAVLGQITNGSTLAIANELDKLALYAMGRDVTVDDVYEICSGERETTQFVLVDAMQDGNVRDALNALATLTATDDVGQLLLTQMATRYRQTATVASLMDAGAGEAEIGKALGAAGNYPGLRQAAMARARRIGVAGATAAMEAIVEADYHGKKNEIDSDLALELLVIRLAEMAAARGR
ncbi:MAG: DNA polymerase III subunit delta [Dehalococcoidia bacterium]